MTPKGFSKPCNNHLDTMHLLGQVAERLNALVSKTSIRFGVSRVRIPPCPFFEGYWVSDDIEDLAIVCSGAPLMACLEIVFLPIFTIMTP